MNDESPFASFIPSTETAEAPASPAKDKGKRTRKRKGDKAAEAPAPTKPKKERKPRAAKKVRAVMLPLSSLLDIGVLNVVESSAVSAIATNLQTVPKKSRTRIVAALAKIFA